LWWLLGGVGLLLAVATVVVIALMNSGGGSTGSGTTAPETETSAPDSVTTASGVTYRVTDATVADTAEEAMATGFLSDFPNTSVVEPTGTYVIVELAVTGGDENTDVTAALVGTDGTRHASDVSVYSYDVDGGDGTRTELFDVPSDTVAGSQLVITEGGTDYTLDLGL
jgi:hypothetical protein